MRILRSHLPFASTLLLAASAGFASAQEPARPTEPAPEAQGAPGQDQGKDKEAPPRRPRRQAIVLEAGTVHPASGPAIENGVVVIRGERIAAVGKKGEVDVPEGAVVRSFPTGHLYPGLVDAATDAYTDANLRGDGSLDAGASFADDLRVRGDRDDELLAAGITTAYVTVRSPATMRGQGAIVRPKAGGFEVWAGRERAGVQMRMTNGPQPTHPLQRQQQLDGLANTFEGLDEYRKAKTDHEEARKKYEKEFADYLAFHQKKKDGDKPKEGDKAPTPAPSTAPTNPPTPEIGPGSGRRPGGRTGRPGGTEPPKGGNSAPDEAVAAALEELLGAEMLAQDPPKPEPGKGAPPQNPPAPAGQGGPGAPPAGDKGEKKDEGPKRPTWPKPPARDPAKDALLAVLDGELPLRIEAHRPDELQAALQLQRKYSIPLLVLEQAYGGASVAAQIADQGACVVLTEVLPNSMPAIYEAFDPTALPAVLQRAGVPFAIASGSARRASLLPLMAAAAVGKGLDRDAALRAITLWPAEILGVAKDTGSLQSGKFADVLVTDRPLFASDCRVLFVASKGRTEFEAK